MTEQHSKKHTCIRMQFAAQRQQGRRHRDIAEDLGISEGQLLAAHVATPEETRLHAKPLRSDWPALRGALHRLGPVMALTRNHACVHEVVGCYPEQVSAAGAACGQEFALQLDYAVFAQGFAVTESNDQGVQRSLQFFDAQGQALHKVMLRPPSNVTAYAALVAHFATAAVPEFAAAPAAALAPLLSSARQSGAQPVAVSGVQGLLEGAAEQALALRISVANAGVEQTRSAPVQRIAVMGPWLNVLDPGFNLHLRQDLVASAWLLPLAGSVALQLLDAQGRLLLSVQEAQPHVPDRLPGSRPWQVLTQELAPSQVQELAPGQVQESLV